VQPNTPFTVYGAGWSVELRWKGFLTCVQKLQVRSSLEHRVVAASNKRTTFNYADNLPTKSQASILAHLNMRYTKREMLNVEPKAGQRGLSVARITTCTYT
jgi:hypothetical protein